MIRFFKVRTEGNEILYQINTKRNTVLSISKVSAEELQTSIEYCLNEGYEIKETEVKLIPSVESIDNTIDNMFR